MSGSIDFHGWYPTDAINKLHSVIGEVRAKGSTSEVEFITGNGKIKQLILAECEKCGIMCREKIGNSGALIALVE